MAVPALTFNGNQVALIRRTVAKDANDDEFNLYIELCKARGLNPLLRHCYCLIMSKDDPKKRQMVIVVSIDGQRHVAETTQNYRPDERAPRFEVDPSLKDPKTNPAGLISAEVSVYKFSHGGWHPVPNVAYWEEAAPLREKWVNNQRTGEYELDSKKDGWRKMPRLMLAKVAEMGALRKAFPDDFSGLYGEAEMDRGEAYDLTPSEMADQSEQEARIDRIGGAGKIIVDWLDGPLDPVPVGSFFDRVAAFARDNLERVEAWSSRNRHAMREFWAVTPGDALELKKVIEAAQQKALAITVEPIAEPVPAPEATKHDVTEQPAEQKPSDTANGDCTPEQKTEKTIALLKACKDYESAEKIIIRSHKAMSSKKLAAHLYIKIADSFALAVSRLLNSDDDTRNAIMDRVQTLRDDTVIAAQQYSEVLKAFDANSVDMSAVMA